MVAVLVALGDDAFPEEFSAGAQVRAAEKFGRLDANSDGVITKDEMEAARQAFRERHSQRKKSDVAF